MSESQSNRVFLSYAAEDRAWVKEFTSALHDAGVNGFFDAAELSPGEPWADRLEQALRQSRVLVLIISPSTAGSPRTLFELGAAVGANKRVIPVLVDDVPSDALPPLVRKYQILRESSPGAAGRRVAEALTKLDAA